MNAAYTIVNRNYLKFAYVLANSYKIHHPSHQFFIFLVDSKEEEVIYSDAYNIIEVSKIGVEDFEHRAFYYDIVELSTSVKPDCALYLMNIGFEKVIYLDPDIKIYSPFEELLKELEQSSIILIPHFLAPVDDGHYPAENDILKTGAYNLGFIALKNSSIALSMLQWWSRRLRFLSFVDFQLGFFTDQKWMDLVPSLYEEVLIFKHPGYDVAYWNLHERQVTKNGSNFQANGLPLRFFHFSGVNIKQPSELSKYQTRFNLQELPSVDCLVQEYIKDVVKFDLGKSTKPYRYGHYSDMQTIASLDRLLYFNIYRSGRVIPSIFNIRRTAFLWAIKNTDKLPLHHNLYSFAFDRRLKKEIDSRSNFISFLVNVIPAQTFYRAFTLSQGLGKLSDKITASTLVYQFLSSRER